MHHPPNSGDNPSRYALQLPFLKMPINPFRVLWHTVSKQERGTHLSLILNIKTNYKGIGVGGTGLVLLEMYLECFLGLSLWFLTLRRVCSCS